MTHMDPEPLLARARPIRLLLLDVDGVLTDGRVVYTSGREQVQGFHVHDGLGLKLLIQAGIDIAILSSRRSEALSLRAEELGIERVLQGQKAKLPVYERLLHEMDLEDREVAYVGDDWLDLPVLVRVGLSVVVADTPPPMEDYAHYVTRHPPGRGAVREVCDLLLKAQGQWTKLLKHYLSP